MAPTKVSLNSSQEPSAVFGTTYVERIEAPADAARTRLRVRSDDSWTKHWRLRFRQAIHQAGPSANTNLWTNEIDDLIIAGVT